MLGREHARASREATDEERGVRAGGLTVDAMTCGVREKALVPCIASVRLLLGTSATEKAWDFASARSFFQG
jgi:hypothetical protein